MAILLGLAQILVGIVVCFLLWFGAVAVWEGYKKLGDKVVEHDKAETRCPRCKQKGYGIKDYCQHCGHNKDVVLAREAGKAAAAEWRAESLRIEHTCPKCGNTQYDKKYYCTHCKYGEDDFRRRVAAVDYANRHGHIF